MGQEPEAAGLVDPVDDLLRLEAVVVDGPLEPECEVVVLPVGRYLLADDHEDTVVPALLAVIPRRERVVVGQEYEVEAIGPRRARDLGNAAGPVRVIRVHVEHSGEVARGGHFSRDYGTEAAIGG